MKREEVAHHLETFDPEIYNLLEEERQRQRTERTVKQVEESTAYYQKNAKPGSLASKANMVAMYDERLAEKRRNKKDKGSDISSGENSNEN
mgnify:CR=1 FL=1